MLEFENSCCFTGYRPEKFNFPLDESSSEFRRFAIRLLTGIADMIDKGCTHFYTGMAMGFDIFAAEQVITFKKARSDIKLIAVVPFKDHRNSISADWQCRYQEVLKESDEIITVSPAYEKWVYSKRNRYMVDRCRYVLTYFDGKSGGTENTLKYAAKNGREILNIYETDVLSEVTSQYHETFGLYLPDNNE